MIILEGLWAVGVIGHWFLFLPIVTRRGMRDFGTPLDNGGRGVIVYVTTIGALLWPLVWAVICLSVLPMRLVRRIEQRMEAVCKTA